MDNIQTIPDKFHKHLKDNKISIESVANYLLCSRMHLWYVLKNIRPLTDEMRIKLNTHLGTTFEPDKEESKENDLQTPLI